MLDLDRRDLDAPRVGLLVENRLEPMVDLLPSRKQLVQLDLAQDRPQGRLRELARRVVVVLDLDDRATWVHDPEVHDGVDFDRHVVPRDDVLWRNVVNHRPQGDPHHSVDDGNQQEKPRTVVDRPQPPQTEDHPALVLGQDSNGADQNEQNERYGHDDADERRCHGSAPVARWVPCGLNSQSHAIDLHNPHSPCTKTLPSRFQRLGDGPGLATHTLDAGFDPVLLRLEDEAYGEGTGRRESQRRRQDERQRHPKFGNRPVDQDGPTREPRQAPHAMQYTTFPI